MRLIRSVIHTSLFFPYCYGKLRRLGPFGADPVSHIDSPPTPQDHSLKKALFRHYVRQFHEASCSVASVVTVVNAIRSGDADQPEPITQKDILETVREGYWKERMSKNGHNGRRGLPLDLLGRIVHASITAYDLKPAQVETISISRNDLRTEALKKRLRQDLIDFETKGDRILIAHFNQGAYLPTLGIPHISPVGGFDLQTGKVTILDVDPTEKGPYQVGFETFLNGLSHRYNPLLRRIGYTNGGYVLIRLF